MSNEVGLLTSSVLSIQEGEKIYPDLVKMKEYAEKCNEDPFSQFDDKDMLIYFIHKRKNVDASKDNANRTRQEYQRELTQMIENMLAYSGEIGIDIDTIIEGSLFKSLAGRHLPRYMDWLIQHSPYVKKRGPYSPATIARKTTIIKNFFSFLYQSKYIQTPIHEALLRATVKSEERPNRDLGPSEVIRLLDYFKKENHVVLFSIIQILVSTGLRNEEFCNLKVSDLKYDTIVGVYYLDVMGKGNKNRKIPLREKTMESIRQFRAARFLPLQLSVKDHSVLFPNSKGKAYTTTHFSSYVADSIERSELDYLKEKTTRITPHTFRHAFAIISYKAGANIFAIMKSLGHAKIETTQIYMAKIFELEEHSIHKWNDGILNDYI